LQSSSKRAREKTAVNSATLILKETVKQKTKNTYLLQLAYTSFKKYSLWDESYFAPLLLVKVVLMLLAMKICLKFAGA